MGVLPTPVGDNDNPRANAEEVAGGGGGARCCWINEGEEEDKDAEAEVGDAASFAPINFLCNDARNPAPDDVVLPLAVKDERKSLGIEARRPAWCSRTGTGRGGGCGGGCDMGSKAKRAE